MKKNEIVAIIRTSHVAQDEALAARTIMHYHNGDIGFSTRAESREKFWVDFGYIMEANIKLENYPKFELPGFIAAASIAAAQIAKHFDVQCNGISGWYSTTVSHAEDIFTFAIHAVLIPQDEPGRKVGK